MLFFSLLTFGLTTFGFAIQNLDHCPGILAQGDTIGLGLVIIWLLFTVLVLFASSGLMALIINFLALWGPNTELGRGKAMGGTLSLDSLSLGLGKTLGAIVVE